MGMKPFKIYCNQSFAFWLPYFIMALFGILYLIMAFCNHYFFRTWTYDYGSYNFAFFDYAHFRISDNPVFPPHISFLQDHVSFALMILSPFYWLLSWLTGTYTLSILQIFLVLLGGLALYKLLEYKTSNRLLSTLALVQYFTLYGRWASFCAPCNIAIIASSVIPVFLYYFEKKKFSAAWLALLFILLTREDMALWTLFIGLFLLLEHFKEKEYRKVSILIIMVSLLYFIFVFRVIIPLLDNQYHKYNVFNYSILGKNPSEALLFLFRHPVKCIELLFVNHSGEPVYNVVKIEFFCVYILCGGFLLFVRPKYLLLFIPLVLKKMYNDLPVRWSIESFYSVEFVSMLPIAVFLIISGIKNKTTRMILIALVCINSLGITVFKLLEKGRALNYDNTNFAFYRSSMYKADFDVATVNRNLSLIPRDAVISAGNSINPHLAFRPKAYFFPRVDDAEYIAVFKARDTWPLDLKRYKQELNKYALSADWIKMVDDSTLVILKKIKK